MRDMKSNKQMVLLGTVTVAGVTPAASSWVDTRGFDAATIVVKTNTVTDAGTGDGFTVTAQHSDLTTAASAAAIVAADATDGVISVQVTSDAADNAIVGGIGYRGSKRYVRMNVVGTTGSDATFDVYAVLNVPHRAKTTFVGTAVAAT